MSNDLPTHFECIEPILYVEDLAISVRYYVDVLGFEQADWEADSFAAVSRDGCGIYLCEGVQGHPGTWIWVGVGDVRALHAAYKKRGAMIRRSPKNEPWALEMHIEDPDGHVLRFGSDPEEEGPTPSQ